MATCSICGAAGYTSRTHIEPTETREKLFEKLTNLVATGENVLVKGISRHFDVFGTVSNVPAPNADSLAKRFVLEPVIHGGLLEGMSRRSHKRLVALGDAIDEAMECLAVRHHCTQSTLHGVSATLDFARRDVGQDVAKHLG